MEDSGFRFGRQSSARLARVHRDLVITAKEALRRSSVDVTVPRDGGARTLEEQQVLVDAGASQTLDSRHRITGDDQLCKAVDLVPWVNHGPRWEWPPIFAFAKWMAEVAHERDIAEHLTWGGVWDKRVSQLDINALNFEVQQYIKRRQHRGLSAFIDGPHWELCREHYP